MPTYSKEDLILISKNTMRVLDEWGLSGTEIINILALPSNIRVRHLERYREGIPFPDSIDLMERVEHIAGIADALRTSFPRNAYMGIKWMHAPHKRFQHKSPLGFLNERGIGALKIVRAELDCTFAWDQSGSK